MAGGQQINSGQGTITYEGPGVTDSLTGSAATTDSGSTAQGTSIRLRSRKVGGGAASFLLTGQFSTVQQETPVKQVSALLATPALSGAQGFFGKDRLRSLSGILVQIAQTSIGNQSGSWDINTVTFTEGIAGTFQLPVPSGYTTGGLYQIVSGSLPSGITMSDAGLLTYNGIGTAASSSLTFAYTEPGALPTLTLHPTITGSFPYVATAYPAEGAVPSGQIILSSTDTNLRSSVLSIWPDGSARVVVMAGYRSVTSGVTQDIYLRSSAPVGSALTASRVSALVSSLSFNFGTGVQTISDFSSPERIWWQNERVICARYRKDLNKGVMEAVIDIHAFDTNNAWIEVVIENGKLNAGGTGLTAPAAQTYTNATITVTPAGGSPVVIATVNPPVAHTWGGQPVYASQTHNAFRAFYVSGWIKDGVASARGGASDPGIEVTHDATYLQSLYVFPGKQPRAKGHNPQVAGSAGGEEYGFGKNGVGAVTQPYSSDLYTPWDYGRMKGADMGQPGGIRQIPRTDWHYVQGPDKYTRRAVIASTLGMLSYTINYRDSVTGNVPTFAQTGTKQRSSSATWPEIGEDPCYEEGHEPGYGLMGFLCQPSPCIIEAVQKLCLYNLTWSTPPASAFNQTRGRAWFIRSAIHAAYLTPESHPFKASADACLYQSIAYVDSFRTSGNYESGMFMGYTLTQQEDGRNYIAGFQVAVWQMAWLILEVARAHRTKVLSDATQREAVRVAAEYLASIMIRWVNDQSSTGGWRYFTQYHTVGRVGAVAPSTTLNTDTDQFANFDEAAQWAFLDYPPPAGNTFMGNANAGDSGGEDHPRYSNYAAIPPGIDYAAYSWPAFCLAVEMGLPGAETMWSTIRSTITNLGTYLNQVTSAPDHAGSWPRNKTLDV